MPSQWITTREAYARYSNAVPGAIKFDSFRRWINEGRLKHRKIKHFREISVQAVDDLIEFEKDRVSNPKKPKNSSKRKTQGNGKLPKPKRKRASRATARERVYESVHARVVSNLLRELRATKKRPGVINMAIDVDVIDGTAKKVLTDYLTRLEKIVVDLDPKAFSQLLR